MNLVVLGASGGCGQELVTQAIARGHTVKAVVRSSTWKAPDGVTVVRGALTDPALLTQAISGSDAVLSALGLRMNGYAFWKTPHDVNFLAQSTPAIVAAMKSTGVKRVIAISAAGVGDSYAPLPLSFRLMISATALRRAYAELLQMETTWLASGLEVCLPRPTVLTNGPKTGNGRAVTRVTGNPPQISRADVADWMLREVEKPSFASRTPVITETGGE